LIGYDVYQNADLVKNTGLKYVSLDELLAQSDIISMHLPLLPDTNHIINAETIEKMKKGVLLVNTSRGGLIDTKALVQGLKSGKLGGVGTLHNNVFCSLLTIPIIIIALDVYEEESGMFFENLSGEILQDDVFARLLTFPNVLITGHQAFFTKEALVSSHLINTKLMI
jgi:D-lactate dehydrogenase